MEEEAAEVRGRRQLADVLDIALRTMGFTLWAMIWSITIRVGNLLNILLDRANKGV